LPRPSDAEDAAQCAWYAAQLAEAAPTSDHSINEAVYNLPIFDYF